MEISKEIREDICKKITEFYIVFEELEKYLIDKYQVGKYTQGIPYLTVELEFAAAELKEKINNFEKKIYNTLKEK